MYGGVLWVVLYATVKLVGDFSHLVPSLRRYIVSNNGID